MKSVYLLISLICAAIGLFLLSPFGCRREPASGLPTIQMQIGSRRFTLEVADTPTTREAGLMLRDSMPAEHGMIFVFPSEAPLGFWMKNTRIPLDILYLDADGRVVSIHQMKPHDTATVRSAAPAKYAIELNQGTAERVGVKAGDRLTIPPEARDPGTGS